MSYSGEGKNPQSVPQHAKIMMVDTTPVCLDVLVHLLQSCFQLKH